MDVKRKIVAVETNESDAYGLVVRLKECKRHPRVYKRAARAENHTIQVYVVVADEVQS
jgi:hypothetical protein